MVFYGTGVVTKIFDEIKLVQPLWFFSEGGEGASRLIGWNFGKNMTI